MLFSGSPKIIRIGDITKNKNYDITIPPCISDILDIKIGLSEDYYSAFGKTKILSGSMPCREFLETDDIPGLKQLMCPEMPLPEKYVSELSLGMSDEAVNAAFLHAGRSGNFTPVHYDWDHQWVLHVCLSGEKTFFFFPPESGWLLNPVVNTSSYKIPVFSQEDQNEFIEKLDGQRVALKAGTAVLFPSLWWHGVSYCNNSLAISIRFEQLSFLKAFTILPRCWLLQRIIWHLFVIQDKTISSKILNEILSNFFRDFDNWLERYHHMNAVYKSILQKFDLHRGTHHWIDQNFDAEVFLAEQELKSLYVVDIFGFSSHDISETIDSFYLKDVVSDDLLIPFAKYALRFHYKI